jgi:hypothetical protein
LYEAQDAAPEKGICYSLSQHRKDARQARASEARRRQGGGSLVGVTVAEYVLNDCLEYMFSCDSTKFFLPDYKTAVVLNILFLELCFFGAQSFVCDSRVTAPPPDCINPCDQHIGIEELQRGIVHSDSVVFEYEAAFSFSSLFSPHCLQECN